MDTTCRKRADVQIQRTVLYCTCTTGSTLFVLCLSSQDFFANCEKEIIIICDTFIRIRQQPGGSCTCNSFPFPAIMATIGSVAPLKRNCHFHRCCFEKGKYTGKSSQPSQLLAMFVRPSYFLLLLAVLIVPSPHAFVLRTIWRNQVRFSSLLPLLQIKFRLLYHLF